MGFIGYDIPIPKLISHSSTAFLVAFLILAIIVMYMNLDNILRLYKSNRITLIVITLLIVALAIFTKINWPIVPLILVLSFYPNKHTLASKYLFIWSLFFFFIIVLLGIFFPELGRESVGKVSSFFGSASGLQAL